MCARGVLVGRGSQELVLQRGSESLPWLAGHAPRQPDVVAHATPDDVGLFLSARERIAQVVLETRRESNDLIPVHGIARESVREQTNRSHGGRRSAQTRGQQPRPQALQFECGTAQAEGVERLEKPVILAGRNQSSVAGGLGSVLGGPDAEAARIERSSDYASPRVDSETDGTGKSSGPRRALLRVGILRPIGRGPERLLELAHVQRGARSVYTVVRYDGRHFVGGLGGTQPL